MPPRLPLAQATRSAAAAAIDTSVCRPIAAASSLVFLFAGLSIQSSQQTRSASILSSLSDNPGAYHKRQRVGRGPSSGYGKTSGRGTKGQWQHGKVKPWFQGGQTPLIVSHGRMGFINHRAPDMHVVNLDRLQEWIDAGRIDPTKQITPREIIKSGIVGRHIKDGIKLLARGKEKLRTPIDICVSRASEEAIKAVEAIGGKVTTRYYTKVAIKRLVQGESIHTDQPIPYGKQHVKEVLEKVRNSDKYYYLLPDPTSRKDIEYYRDPAHRGYLSHTLKPGESPSLYFKVPSTTNEFAKPKSKRKQQEMEYKLF